MIPWVWPLPGFQAPRFLQTFICHWHPRRESQPSDTGDIGDTDHTGDTGDTGDDSDDSDDC